MHIHALQVPFHRATHFSMICVINENFFYDGWGKRRYSINIGCFSTQPCWRCIQTHYRFYCFKKLLVIIRYYLFKNFGSFHCCGRYNRQKWRSNWSNAERDWSQDQIVKAQWLLSRYFVMWSEFCINLYTCYWIYPEPLYYIQYNVVFCASKVSIMVRVVFILPYILFCVSSVSRSPFWVVIVLVSRAFVVLISCWPLKLIVKHTVEQLCL